MKYLLYIMVFTGSIYIHAQSYQLSFQHINSNHQLPEANIECIYEHNNMLYIGTEDGLFAFNGGLVFKIPLGTKGEKINVTSMVSDSLGNLWIGSYNGLYIYNKDEKTIRIDSFAGKELNYVETIYDDEEGNIWLLSGADNNALITYNIFSTRFSYYGDNYNSIRGFKKEKGKMKELWFMETKGAYQITLKDEKPRVKNFFDGENNSEVYHVNDIYVDLDGNALLSTTKGIKIISAFDLQEDENILQNLYSENVSSTIIYKNVLLISTSTEGLIVFDIPSKRVVARFTEDYKDEGAIHSNSIKFSTVFNNCLYIVNTNNTIDYCGLNDNEFTYIRDPAKTGFHDIARFNDKILVAGNDSTAYDMRRNEFKSATEIESPVSRLQTLDSQLYAIHSNKIKAYNNDQVTSYIFENSSVTAIYGLQKNRDILLANTNAGIYQLLNGKAAPIHGLENEVYKRYAHFLVIDENTLLINAYYSYFLTVTKSSNAYSIKSLIKHVEQVNQLLLLQEDPIDKKKVKAIIVSNEAVSLMDFKNESIKKIKTSSGEKFYRIIYEGTDSFLLISNKGIQQCYFAGDSMITVNSWNNIPVENLENNDVELIVEKVYIPLQKGVLIFDKKNKNANQYQLHINNIQISNKGFKTNWNKDTIRTRFSKSEISMDIGLTSSHIHHQTYIKYFLSKENAGLVTEGRKSKIYFDKISPGEHTLTIQALDKDGKILAEEKIILLIEKEWYQTIWFYLVLGFMILLIGYILFKWRLKVENKKIRRQELMLRKIKESENLALRSQMNPHFIFNTLNSINTFIVNEDNENASSYLAMFSKLIRNTLDLTRSEKVTLAREIETLKLYMDIEKSRTNFKFDYQIKMDEEIDASFIKVPPLIIQPFVENSIWHGIQGIEGRGLIEIEINQPAEDLITISITDNGVGRKALKPKAKKTSHGLNITRERLSIWNAKSYFEITDLVNEKNESSGTKVIIYLYY